VIATVLPPATDRGDGERGSVVIGADVDPAGVRGDVADPVRDRLARSLPVKEVMGLDLGRQPLRLPLSAPVLVLADKFLLLVSTLIAGSPAPMFSLAGSLM
jgi:hypothetical protein